VDLISENPVGFRKEKNMVHIRKFGLLSSLLLFVLGCNLVSNLTSQPPTANPSPSLAATSKVIDATATSDPLAACPQPTAGTQLYVNLDNGFCLLYPDGFSVQAGLGVPALPVVNITGPQVITPGPKQQEGSFNAGMSINRNGPTDGLDSQAYAAQWLERFAPSMNLPQEQITIGGIPAIRVHNLPSYGSLLGAFVVSPYARYTFNLSPEPQYSDPALAEQANNLWDTVTNSLVFFQPKKDMGYVPSANVCPQPATGETGYINQVDGYCMVFPSDYREDPTFPGRIIGGPILGSTADFPDVQTNLMVGTFGISNGMAPRDYLAQLPKGYFDPASVTDLTIGGAPAVVYNNLAGPWRSRNAYIVLPSGDVYTIVSQPDDPTLFPEGIPYLNKLFNPVVMSLKFFTPWR
jgi:hypothetical protein